MDFEMALSKSKARDLKELEYNVRKIKEMNIPIAKPLIDIHSNICWQLKQNNKSLTIRQCYTLEQMIYHCEDPKIIIKLLETKIARKTQIETMLRLMILFSLTLSGLKKDDFDNLKRIFLQTYGYHEMVTLCNL